MKSRLCCFSIILRITVRLQSSVLGSHGSTSSLFTAVVRIEPKYSPMGLANARNPEKIPADVPARLCLTDQQLCSDNKFIQKKLSEVYKIYYLDKKTTIFYLILF